MHILKYILVSKKELEMYSQNKTSENENTSEIEQENDITDDELRFEAISAIDTLGKFDWRTDDAGRWKDKYPNNVIRGDNNEADFAEIINHILDVETSTLNSSIEKVKKINEDLKCNNTDDIFKILLELNETGVEYSLESNKSNFIFSLRDLIELSVGIYNIDSIFYDIETNSSTISKRRVDEILGSPQDYAIVLFDVHI